MLPPRRARARQEDRAVVEAPIFVVGTGRSGTTLLRMMLSAHPRIYLTHEASFCLLESMFPARQPAERFVGYYFRSASFRWLGLDPRAVMEGVARPVTRPDLGRVFARVMALKAAEHGKARFGDKTPSHAGNLGRIFELWPDARVVRIVRDPRAVVRSLRSMPWGPGSAIGAAAMCEVERRQVARFAERVLKVRLSDLLAEPRAVMARVLEYVGEPWSEQVLDHARFGPEGDMPPLPWFARAARAASGPASEDWSGWDPVELRLVEWLTRDCMREDGYAPAAAGELAGAAGRLAVLGRWVGQMPTAISELATVAGAVRRARADAGQSGAELMAMFRRLNPAACAALGPGFAMPDPPALPQGWEAALAVPAGRLATTQ
jgi:hypothetical protein